ncbi:YbaB/EbfC family nucleoid-associated protein [Nitratidesulfovibrio sp. HK-II]|uniref:Nucleoid-associated protein DvMF_2270 n=2 Tax=Nitratidesulfovibrio TaxID=2802295 RepID=B8DQU4_NITV9|nr:MULTISPECIES: YbaB/EbfC family nucleoid-associated protein [Nitratidesulfovibrio]MBG3877916.1 YbaB/EbfC family nucleoid-associated protein [Nitratidesulfovibrio oxamicus]MDR3045859.1 YbaB/EbfC family nucleoid-associated protein [Desulfovibrio sp.]NHZ47106.1 YbaB/EbfC family nucleoid-associated protein [Nitratidesulfovibrio liaohensis]
MRGMNDLLRQAQVMQTKMSKLQAEMADRTLEATSGGGMVKVTVSGKQEVKAIVIDPKAVDPNDVEMLQDLVLTAVNEGLRQAKDMMEKEMGALTGGLKMPGLF